MNRVPHCSECERCQCTDFIYKDYYCCEGNDTMEIFGRLGVDHLPKSLTQADITIENLADVLCHEASV